MVAHFGSIVGNTGSQFHDAGDGHIGIGVATRGNDNWNVGVVMMNIRDETAERSANKKVRTHNEYMSKKLRDW